DDGDWAVWTRLRLPLVERLAVAGEPVPLEWLADHVGQPANEIKLRALNAWSRFLAVSDQPARWRIVHQSFREFLSETNALDLAGAHRAIARWYLEDQRRWTAHERYAARHLTEHLARGDASDELLTLVDRAEWRASQLAVDPTGSSYLTDVALAWDAAT